MISSDPRGPLASWNDSVHFCRWLGVTCGGGRRHPQRVISLSLSSLGLAGIIPPAIANLTFLREIDLSGNQIHGFIPEEIGRLFRLRHLDLSKNSLGGGIPTSLSSCTQLQNISLRDNMLRGEIPPNLSCCSDILLILDLGKNSLSGSIPPSVGNLSSLIHLDLSVNNLSGNIPLTVGNLASLTVLYLHNNSLSGSIPPSLGKLSNLQGLYLPGNNLSGVIPPSLWNISSLSVLFLAYNKLSGRIPPNLGQPLLPLLKELHLYNNRFHGPLPTSLSNASHLVNVDLSANMFSGTIPPNLGVLQHLRWLGLHRNQLEVKEPDGWDFLTALTNCTRLEALNMGYNNLSGMLPDSIANLSTKLTYLSISYNNYISGKISPYIGNLVNLTVLEMTGNSLTGSIPASIGMLQKLHELWLNINKLSGDIPFSISNLTQLNHLYLDFNELSGNIPASLGKCQNLAAIYLGYNKLTGAIPKEVLTISTLSLGLSLPYNSLTGLIPTEIGNLKNLEIIDVSMNKLSGELPSSLGGCQVAEELYLGGNFLQGRIPITFSSLRGLSKLDISKNNLSGNIPYFLQDFPFLSYLNISFNNFEGEVPRLGVFRNASEVSLIGNNKLCGGNLEMHLPACSSQSPNKKHGSHALTVIIGISSSLLFLIMFFCFLMCRCWRKGSRREHHRSSAIKEQYDKISYAELVKATNGFSTNNIIGIGGFGAVYKGILNEESGNVVAVKVLNLQTRGASKSFIAECEAMRNIRHRNLVKILTTCSSIDFRGNDFKAVVFEFMGNGSLDDWLHPRASERSKPKKLNLMQRLNIAIDVASALDYIHHYGTTPIIHCDLKPNNVLLDDDMTVHVGDFGLARFLKKVTSESSQNSTSTVGLKGTIGYIAPEYGMGNKVSTRGDVYSYGILLLEMFTGKRPTDDAFAGGLSLRMFVEMAFPERILDAADARLFLREDGNASDDTGGMEGARAVECIAMVLRMGVSCSNELPAERMEMGVVIRELHQVKEFISQK